MADGKPADGADKIAGRGSVDGRALRKPSGGRAAGMDSGVERRGGVGELRAWNNDDEGAERVGAGEKMDSFEGAKQPR